MNPNADEMFAHLDDQLSDLIREWRESLDRKRERHGEQFDDRKAITDLWARLKGMPAPMAVALVVASIDRLAHMEDYNPIPAQIAGLDFETPDLEELMKDDGEQ